MSSRTEDTLKITEIFYSLQGESITSGVPTVFVRLTGCPLRCVYCDTEYAFHGGTTTHLEEIIQQISKFKTRYVTVTGGEPLAQKNVLALMTCLCDLHYKVSLETSGAIDVSGVDTRVSKVMDLKTPASGEVDKNLYKNILYLSQHDQVKFVISNREDYEWSKMMVNKYTLEAHCEILFSPVADALQAVELADWIIEDQLAVRFQIQLHKVLWGDKPGV